MPTAVGANRSVSDATPDGATTTGSGVVSEKADPATLTAEIIAGLFVLEFVTTRVLSFVAPGSTSPNAIAATATLVETGSPVATTSRVQSLGAPPPLGVTRKVSEPTIGPVAPFGSTTI